MNVEKVGNPIALIVDENDPKKNKILSVHSSKKDVLNTLEKIQLDEKHHFQQIPNTTIERSILYITGASGSGKSYYTAQYIKQYKRLYPKRDIYIFSSLNEDKVLDALKVKRVKLDENLLTEHITAEDFKNSLVIFDDTDALTNKMMKTKVNNILNSILQTGRHFDVSCILTYHTPTGNRDTTMILNEAHSITIFPHSLGGRKLKYLLMDYIGLDKEQVKKIKNLESRWVTICKTYPMTILSEREAYVLNTKE